MHRRIVVLDRRAYTVLSLRASTPYRFATNHFHNTWHVITDVGGARLLARLLWGLAYQRRPGTLIVIDRPFLVPTPFEADPSDPIVLANADLGVPRRQALLDLGRDLPLAGQSAGTVRLLTHGLDLEREAATVAFAPSWNRLPRPTIERVGGVLLISATPPTLRKWAVRVDRLRDHSRWESDYTELDYPNGEVQVFRTFASMVSTAARAREMAFPARRHVRLGPSEAPLVWADAAAARRERDRTRRRRRESQDSARTTVRSRQGHPQMRAPR